MRRIVLILLALALPRLAAAEVVAGSTGATVVGLKVTDSYDNTSWMQPTGRCYAIKIQDYGTGTPLSSSLTVSVSPNSGTLYSDSGCKTSASSVTIAAGASSATAYFKATSSGSVQLKASVNNKQLTLLTYGFATVVNFSQIGFNPDPLTQNVGTCGALKIEAQNDSGDAVAVDSAFGTVDVQLSTSSSTGAFYSDSSCTSSTDSLSIASGSSSATVYYKDTTAQEDVFLQAMGNVIALTVMEPEMIMAFGTGTITPSPTSN